MTLLHTRYKQHETFLLIFLLFVSFRFLAIFLFRPGGFIADASDYDFYYAWGQMTPLGRRVFDNMWTAYPPLFPAIMLPIFEWSSRIPPWVEPRFFFHTLFGLVLLIFESGNLILIYRLSIKLHPPIKPPTHQTTHPSNHPSNDPVTLSSCHPVILSPLLYALLFVPVYTMLGWFEPLPLFFMLLGLDLLLSRRQIGWIGSAFAAALGFLVKLTPILLLPIAIRWLGARLSWRAARKEWFNRQSTGNLLRPTLYCLIFIITVVGIGYPLVQANPRLALSSFQIQSIRPPWQSIWALFDGYYEAGIVPLRMDNLVGLEGPLWESQLPWSWITLGFAFILFFLYTRSFDWQQPRTPLAFAAISIILLFLYSKGWSPQFLVWILAFLVLLLPTTRGILIAITLSFINLVESGIFLVMLPAEMWLLWGTVLLRTTLLGLLTLEFFGQIWRPSTHGQVLRRTGVWLSWATVFCALLGTIVATPQTLQAYETRRWNEHLCQEAILYLSEQASWPNSLLVSGQIEVWRDLHPWMRTNYDIRIVDGYSPIDEDPHIVMEKQLTTIAEQGEFWWIDYRAPGIGPGDNVLADRFFNAQHVHILEQQILGGCDLQRVVYTNPADALALLEVEGGPIRLMNVENNAAVAGQELHLVLYWQAESPVHQSYTVFTQLLGPDGTLVAQQDNVPVEGLAPTDTWSVNKPIRDIYRLTIPNDAESGDYHLLIGLYQDNIRSIVTLPDGTKNDHIRIPIVVAKK
ncbi:hypothetical protein KFU94_52975 [Chloroflexi bacterium TSY]|nr:hypothetical protein [Chloroflexi bacterium TSY]